MLLSEVDSSSQVAAGASSLALTGSPSTVQRIGEFRLLEASRFTRLLVSTPSRSSTIPSSFGQTVGDNQFSPPRVQVFTVLAATSLKEEESLHFFV